MSSAVIIDTNVLVVANGHTPQADAECEAACIRALSAMRSGHVILIDSAGEILTEYRRHCSLAGQPGTGDAFFKWLHDHLGSPQRCRMVTITPHEDRGYAEFPSDPELQHFDPDDRKFVAVALASGSRPDILNATDSDWWQHRVPLEHCGVSVRQLCPNLMKEAR